MESRPVRNWAIESGAGEIAASGATQPWPANARALALRLGLLAALYFAIAGATLATFGTSTPIWFANAVAVVALLREDIRSWPIALILVWASGSAATFIFAGGPAPVLAFADVLEITLAAFAIRRIGGGHEVLSSLRGLVGLIAVALTVPLLSAAIGATVLWWSEGAPLLHGIVLWYAASALGLLILCPSLLIWTTPGAAPGFDRRLATQTAAFSVALAALAVLVFAHAGPAYLFVTFPALLLLVWSSGLAGVSIGTGVLLLVGTWHLFAGDSAIAALVPPGSDVEAEVHAFQIYLTALTLASLPLAVVLTAQRELSAELARVADARREFLAAMSHEIRTPMTGVLGIVDLLEDEPLSERQRSYLHKIKTSGRHLLNIINDVLDFSRIETGKVDLEQVDFSIPLLLETVRSLLHPLAVERGIALRFDLSPHSPPVVKGDPTRLRQVLLNLAANAIKFTHDGSVTVAVSCENGEEDEGADVRIRFVVQDTGIGIAADKQAGLFTAFTQADRSTRRRYGGSGLGLAISKRLVDAMGGEIGLSSVIGAGSVFWFEIPLLRGDPRALVTAARAASAPLARCRILLAEDVDLNRDIVTTMLEREGHEVVIAHNGRQALVHAQLSRFDLILMDVHMPVMDGIEATRRIRALPGSVGRTPIVALTANVMAGEQERYLGAGMDAVLMKPIDWDRVRSVIREFARPDGEAAAFPAAKAEAASERDGRPGAADRANGDRKRRGSEPVLVQDTLDKLRQILPPHRLKAHALSLAADVATLAGEQDLGNAEAIRSIAHKIVSQAGMLGLLRLSRRAAEVEQACWDEAKLGAAMERFREAAADPREALGELVGQP